MADREEPKPVRKLMRAGLGVVLVAALGWLVTTGLDAGKKTLKRSDEPIDVTIEPDLARAYVNQPPWQTYDFVTSKRRLGRPPSMACRSWQRWAIGNGGVDADETVVFVTLQGRSGRAVSVENVEVEVVEKDKPVRGRSGHCSAGGAVGSPRRLDIDLDDSPPSALFADLGDDFPKRSRLTITLNGAETETLELHAHTRRCDCRWRARLHLLVNGEPQTIEVDARGKPFRTSSSREAEHVARRGNRWVRMTRGQWRDTLPVRWAHLKGR